MREWYVLGLLDVESVKGGVNIVVGSGHVGPWSSRTRGNVHKPVEMTVSDRMDAWRSERTEEEFGGMQKYCVGARLQASSYSVQT